MTIFSWEQSVSDFFASFPRSGPLFDFMYFISYPGKIGFVCYAIIGLLWFRKKFPEIIPLLIYAAAAVGTCDLFSRRIIKDNIMRPRPHFVNQICNEPHCWGFVSSHAINITSLVTIFVLYDKRNLYWGLPFVLLVYISRLYLLDHYPLDVLCGAGLGAAIGIFYFLIYERFVARFGKTSGA